jgi:nucleoside-diphosphate-sugar epimerase
MANATHHALVIGASGFIGWSVANQLLAPYPLPSPYLKVTKLVNRPLKLSDSFWPKAALGRPSLALFTGVDLLCSDGELVAMFKRKVENVESITHVYYCGMFPPYFSDHQVPTAKAAFKEHAHPEKEVEINVGMMRRVVRAVKVLSPNLQFFVYPGGTRVLSSPT